METREAKQRGRPRIEPGGHVIVTYIGLTPAQHRRMKELSAQRGTSISALVREVLDRVQDGYWSD